MSFKCILTPHYRIPPPILSILVGRLPQVSTIIEDVTEEATTAETIKLDETADDQADSWDKDWGWNVDEAPKSPSPDDRVASSSNTSDYAHAFSPLTESYMVSTSPGGGYMVLAHKSKFVVIELNEEEEEYCAVGQGSGCEMEGEEITAILCLPLFVPSIRKNQMFVMAGYNTGWLRVFSETGTILTAQLLEPTPILSIKIRTPPPVYKTAATQSWQDEEITLLFQGNKVVSIDGQSLWMVLRVCDGQRESGIDSSRMHTAFTYKKYEFQKHDQVKDVVSLGPSPPRSTPTTILEQSSTISTIPFPPTATSRYIAVGYNPMLCYYATTDSSRPLMSAVSMASYVVSRVATPVFSLAKSWWSGGGNNSNSGSSPTPYVPDMHPPPSNVEPATPIPVVLTLEDPDRRITNISVAPASTSSQRSTLAATTDLLGRVILWDLQSGEMVRMWKGIRDAVCGWVEISEDNSNELCSNQRNRPARVSLFLVIYSERRGLLLVFHMRHGAKVGIFRIGQGWRLVPCGREPLGSSMVSADRRRAAMRKDEGECGCLSKCLLIGPDGEVRNIQIVPKE
ncbi:Rab3 GTPase-activating protein regulatory subunit N-terminus-domain-containing protein [Circinella umbellata]|nr:Rab3 GTPase-activating protein regulatory subunit N-terminus-domain-containing protein [Circinella umbellata]